MTSGSRKRVLFISHSADFYGAEQVLYFLVESLRSMYDVHVAIPGCGMLADSLAESQGVTIHKLDLPAFTKKPLAIIGSLYAFVRYFYQLRSLLRRIEPDLLYGNTIRNYITCLYAHMLGYPCILHIHEKNVGMPAGRIIAEIMGRYAERVIYVSRFARETYEARTALLRYRGITIYNGVQAEIEKDADPGMSGMGVPEGSFPVLAAAANLSPHKRLDDLIEAMETISRGFPNALLQIAGEGTYRSQLEGNIEKRGLQNKIILKGYVNDMASFLDTADIVLCPFQDEGFGLVALEAMARKKPVIAADSGALPEIVEDGKTGLLYPVGNVVALIEKIRQLAESPEMSYRLGQQGFLRATQDFAGSLQVEQVRGVIEDVSAAREMQGRQGHA